MLQHAVQIKVAQNLSLTAAKKISSPRSIKEMSY